MLKFWGGALIAVGALLVADTVHAQLAGGAGASCETDFNGDGQTDATDVQILSDALGSTDGDDRYVAAADLNDDGTVSTLDHQIMLGCN